MHKLIDIQHSNPVFNLAVTKYETYITTCRGGSIGKSIQENGTP